MSKVGWEDTASPRLSLPWWSLCLKCLQDGLGYSKIFISLQQPREKLTYEALKFTRLYPNVPVSLLLFLQGLLNAEYISPPPHCKRTQTQKRPYAAAGVVSGINPQRHRAPAGSRGNCVSFSPVCRGAFTVLQASLPTRLKVDIWIQLLMSFIPHVRFSFARFRGDDAHCDSQQ